MAWVLRLVETGGDGQAGSLDVLEISRPDNLRNVVDLGLTLAEAKQLLARVQQAVVAAQARDHTAQRPDCLACGGRCHVKDWRSHQIATLFGAVAVRLPRFRCPGCGRGETGIRWPAHCRSTPELDQLQAHLSALMTYRVAAGVLAHLLPVVAGKSPETLRGHTLKLGERLRDAATIGPAASASAVAISLDSTVHPQLPRGRTTPGGSRRQRRDSRGRPAGVRRCRERRHRPRGADPAHSRQRGPDQRHGADRVH